MGDVTWDYTYNVDGLRTSKTNGTTTYNYTYTGDKLTCMTVGDNTLYFAYDASGVPMSVTYNDVTYYYVTNVQGDVIALVNSTGVEVATYAYDAWGNPIDIPNAPTSEIGTLNPLRYRGYVWDSETKLYYLQSRYYNPEIGRFINGDSLSSTGQSFLGNNMFTYCLNQPVNKCDPNGMCSYSVYYGGAVPDGNCYRCAQLVVMYDVPLYYQGNTKLCWAFCTVMTEDFRNGIDRGDRGAFLAAKDLAIWIHGEDDWNKGFHPLNCAEYTGTGEHRTPVKATDIETFIDLALHLKENGPIYAEYHSVNPNKNGIPTGHVVVVTGVDCGNNRVYTNNPWGHQGFQSYEDFLCGFLGAQESNPYVLVGYYAIGAQDPNPYMPNCYFPIGGG